MSLMRRLPIVFAVGSLVVGAGIIGAAPVNDLQTAPLDTVAAHPATEEDYSITAPPQVAGGGPPQIQSKESTQHSPSIDSNELSAGVSASPEHAEPPASNDSPKGQAALEPPAPRSLTKSIDEHPAASDESEFAMLPHVAVPLPPERPSPEITREQNLLAAPLFAEVKLPSAGATRLVGFYSAGCMAGGQSLALQGPHWQVMRPSRNRYWGHSNLINFIERLAENVSKHTDWPGILVGDMAQHGAGLGPVGLQKGLAQRRRHHALLGFGDIGEGVAHPMHAAALPAGAKHPPDCCFERFMGVGDDQLHATQPTPRQALQKA